MFLVAYPLVMVPIFIGVLVRLRIRSAGRGQMIGDALQNEVNAGLLTPQDLAECCSAGARLRARGRPPLGRLPGWKARDQLHQAASELAFHRRRVALGDVPPAGAEVPAEAAYLARLRQELQR